MMRPPLRKWGASFHASLEQPGGGRGAAVRCPHRHSAEAPPSWDAGAGEEADGPRLGRQASSQEVVRQGAVKSVGVAGAVRETSRGAICAGTRGCRERGLHADTEESRPGTGDSQGRGPEAGMPAGAGGDTAEVLWLERRA